MTSAHEIPKLHTARRTALRNLADAEYALDAARKAFEDAVVTRAAAKTEADNAQSRYDQARAEVGA